MLQRFNSYLLTNYPLLWNTRIAWLTGANIVIHLLFFLAGVSGISADTLQEHSSFYSVGIPGLLFFSILTSLAVLIIWLAFYLRNNAFKSFYIIGRLHSFREFVIVLAAVLSSIIYFESFFWGVRVKTRMITSREQFVREANTINLAMAFLPQSKQDFFILDSCKSDRAPLYDDDMDYFDTTRHNYHDTNFAKVRQALKRPDAFSYKNYCSGFLILDQYNRFIAHPQWIATRNRWIDNRQTDSIRYILDQLFVIAKKYHIAYSVTADELVQLVFADSNHAVTRVIPSHSGYGNNMPVSYFNEYELSRAMDFIDASHLNSQGEGGDTGYLIELYVALSLAIFLFCYRLYSKKVFLVSIVGTIVWTIVFVLVTTSDHSAGGSATTVFYLALFTIFTITGLLLLAGKSSKTITGAVLNWHAYMLPFVVILAALLISDNYRHDHSYYPGSDTPLTEEDLKAEYPVGYWIDHHMALLGWINLLFVFLYVSFSFSRLSKRWHIMPEE
ncbi:MAG: hypothetical protein ABW019_04120 [Chitinophagaceae bacterium]